MPRDVLHTWGPLIHALNINLLKNQLTKHQQLLLLLEFPALETVQLDF